MHGDENLRKLGTGTDQSRFTDERVLLDGGALAGGNAPITMRG